MTKRQLSIWVIVLGLFLIPTMWAAIPDAGDDAPTTLPANPSEDAANVLALYSSYYTPVTTFKQGSGAGSTSQVSVHVGAENRPMIYINGLASWSFMEFSAAQNVTEYSKIEFDVFNPQSTLIIKIRLNESGGILIDQELPTGWNHVSLDLSSFGTLAANKQPDFTAIQKIGLINNAGLARKLYVDNVYFKKSTTVVGDSKATVPVTSAGWASVCFPYDVTIPDGVEAYYAKAAAGSTITLAKVMDMIPAEEGVIVKASEGNVEFTKTEGAAAIADNLFVGTTSAGLVNQGENYVLSGVNGGNPVFKLFSEGNGMVYMPPFKAYLPSERVGSGARTLNFVFEEETNAIRNVVEKTQNYKKVMENGRFFIYHCDKKYNAAGQLMKQ